MNTTAKTKPAIIKILIVEDDSDDLYLYGQYLNKEYNSSFFNLKFDCINAQTLREATDFIKKEKFDLILLDLNLPDSNGVETVKSVQNIASDIPIIVLTGMGDLDTSIGTLKLGVQDYIIKGKFIDEAFVSTILYAYERQRLYKELEQKTKIIEASNKELQEFAYVASHDLQAPLRMIVSYLQLLEKKYSNHLDNTAKEYIEFSIDGAKRMKILIDNLLDLSKVETGGKKFSKVDIDDILKLVVRNLQYKITESSAKVTFGSLPVLHGDESQLLQLFQNLIDNSIKYCKNKTPEININAKENREEWIFSIKDNGIGISMEQNEKVFQIFQRLHANDNYGGAGIGLAICKKIVERHGGKIWVESEEGIGSTFFFTMLK